MGGVGSLDTTGLQELCEAVLGQKNGIHALPWLESLILDGNNVQTKGMLILSQALHARDKTLQRFTTFASNTCTIRQDCVTLNITNRNLGPVETNFLSACLQRVNVDH